MNKININKEFFNKIKEDLNLILFNMKGFGLEELKFVNIIFKSSMELVRHKTLSI